MLIFLSCKVLDILPNCFEIEEKRHSKRVFLETKDTEKRLLKCSLSPLDLRFKNGRQDRVDTSLLDFLYN